MTARVMPGTSRCDMVVVCGFFSSSSSLWQSRTPSLKSSESKDSGSPLCGKACHEIQPAQGRRCHVSPQLNGPAAASEQHHDEGRELRLRTLADCVPERGD